MNVKQLDDSRKDRLRETVYIYKDLVEVLWTKIQEIDKNDCSKNHIYQIPNFIFGEPRYDRDIAFAIIKRKLQKGGFVTQSSYVNDSYIILISWNQPDNFDPGKQTNKSKRKFKPMRDD